MAEHADGVAYDPKALDETERRFWRECWESVPADVAAKCGIEFADLRPEDYLKNCGYALGVI